MISSFSNNGRSRVGVIVVMIVMMNWVWHTKLDIILVTSGNSVMLHTLSSPHGYWCVCIIMQYPAACDPNRSWQLLVFHGLAILRQSGTTLLQTTKQKHAKRKKGKRNHTVHDARRKSMDVASECEQKKWRNDDKKWEGVGMETTHTPKHQPFK